MKQLAPIKNVLLALMTLTCAVVKAQVTVTTAATAAAVASSIAGPGVIVNNVVINCTSGAYGTFSSTGTTGIGLSQGLLLTTGNAVISGPASAFNSVDIAPIGTATPPALFPVLATISGASIHDVCEIQFDIIPNCTMLQMTFVFGSEEYPEFACSSVNDAFAFLVSGPNPLGGSYVDQNIALVPGTSVPVTINTINDDPGFCTPGTVYPAYYINNASNPNVKYDGITTPLIAEIQTTTCSTYHMKLQIADGGDGIYDSGVFLNYQGLTCPSAPPLSGSPNQTVCPGQLTTLSVSGGTTYTWTTSPSTATITYINDSTIVANPSTTTTYTATSFYGCGPLIKDIVLTVNAPRNMNFSPVIHPTCFKNNGSFSVASPLTGTGVVGGSSPFTFDFNSSGIFTSTRSWTGLAPGTYTVTVKDVRGCTYSEAQVLNNIGGMLGTVSKVDSSTCSLPNGGLTVLSVIGSTPPLSYSFDGGPFTTAASISGLPANGNYHFTIKDNVGCLYTDSVVIKSFLGPSKIWLSSTPDTCALGKGVVKIDSISGGTGPYTYQFDIPMATTDLFLDGLHFDPEHIVTAVDFNGCERKDTILVDVIAPPVVSAGNDIVVCEGNPVYLNGAVAEATVVNWSSNGSGTFSNSGELNAIYYPSDADALNRNISFTLVTIDHFPACAQAMDNLTTTIDGKPVAKFNTDLIQSCVPFTAVVLNESTVHTGTNIEHNKWILNTEDTVDTPDFIKLFQEQSAVNNLTLVVETEYGCKDTFYVFNKIIAYKQPVASFAPDQDEIIEDNPISFYNSSINADSYKWFFGNPDSSTVIHPVYTYSDPNTYTITLIANENQFGCTDTFSYSVLVKPDIHIFIPNSFTPNDDFVNDTFQCIGAGITSFELKIFNRWGQLVFESNDITKPWDGKINGVVAQDVYVYTLVIHDHYDRVYNYKNTLTILK